MLKTGMVLDKNLPEKNQAKLGEKTFLKILKYREIILKTLKF